MVLNSQTETQSRAVIHSINSVKNTKRPQSKKWSLGFLTLTVRLCQIILLHVITLLAIFIGQFLLCNKQTKISVVNTVYIDFLLSCL